MANSSENSLNAPHHNPDFNPTYIYIFRALRHAHHSFPRQRYHDGEPLPRTISTMIQVTFRYVVIVSCINIEYNLDAKEE